jgi:hypothetical protein
MNKKNIEIEGKTNRYWINKLTTDKRMEKKKGFSSEIVDFSSNAQLAYISEYPTEITKKINNYSQQDKLKKFNEENFIDFEFVKNMLYETSLKCSYCKENVLFRYDIQREMKQWTLDRIDNNKGHSKDNVVIACLKCNLKRRNQSHKNFLFTSQLSIKFQDH